MKTLQQIWAALAKEGHESDKGSVHSYIDFYEELFSPLRQEEMNVLEVGLFNGASLRMWHQYFENAFVCGMDCDQRPHGGMADLGPMMAEDWNIFIGDAETPTFIDKACSGMLFKIVIEDAGHHTEQQVKIYNNIKPYLAPGAIYVIEDLQNVERDWHIYENIDPEKEVTLFDRRALKGRYDDCLLVITDKK